MEEIEAIVKAGRKLPKLPSVDARLKRLQDYKFCNSERHQNIQWHLDKEHVDYQENSEGDVGREYASPSMLQFADAFIAKAAVEGIPLHCRWMDPDRDVVSIVHSHWGMLLPEEDWDILGRIGYATMRSLSGVYGEWNRGSDTSVFNDNAIQLDEWRVWSGESRRRRFKDFRQR